MDPHAEQVPGLALPKPSSEQGAYNAMPYQPGTRPEAMMPSPEASHGSPAAPSTAQPQTPAMPMQQPPVAASVPAVAPPVAAPASDGDTDALDEEWINKAKAIVEQTKYDPHLESQELSRVKADYLRIRYNRHIKVAEDNNR